MSAIMESIADINLQFVKDINAPRKAATKSHETIYWELHEMAYIESVNMGCEPELASRIGHLHAVAWTHKQYLKQFKG